MNDIMSDIITLLKNHENLPILDQKNIVLVSTAMMQIKLRSSDSERLPILCQQFEENTKSLTELSDIRIAEKVLQALSTDIKSITDPKLYNKLEEIVLKNVAKPLATKKIINHFVDLKENNKVFDKTQIDNSSKFVKELLAPLSKTALQQKALDENTKKFVKECAQEVGTVKTSFIEKIKHLCQEFLSCVFPYMKGQDKGKAVEIQELLSKKEVQNITQELKKHATSVSENKINKNQNHKNGGRGL